MAPRGGPEDGETQGAEHQQAGRPALFAIRPVCDNAVAIFLSPELRQVVAPGRPGPLENDRTWDAAEALDLISN